MECYTSSLTRAILAPWLAAWRRWLARCQDWLDSDYDWDDDQLTGGT